MGERAARADRTTRAVVALAVAVTASLLAVLTGATGAGADPVAVRYLDPVFSDVVVTSDITYGQAVNQQGELQSLELDLYEPAGDTATERPLIVWFHGGSFAYGSKTGGFDQEQGRELAKRGFVVASVEYRLAPQPISPQTMYQQAGLTAIGQAHNDARSAVAFLRTNAATYGIDPDVILASGYSAGGVIAANLAILVVRANGVGAPTDPSHVDGAIPYAGTTPKGFVEPGEPPLLFFHGTNDTTVPYSMTLDLHQTALARGLDSTLVAKAGYSHDLSPFREEFRERIGAWTYERWLAPVPRLTGLSGRVAPESGGTEVTISGDGFSGATDVRFGTVPATFTVVDDATIVATAPAQPAAVVGVRVTGPGGTSGDSLATLFRYDGPPRITKLVANRGPASGGGTVEVRGGGFVGTTSVRFGTEPAAFTLVNDGLLRVTVPPGQPGALVNVWVTDDLGTSANQPSSWYLNQFEDVGDPVGDRG